eukprot:5681241-Prymnesium_polylepis.1
MLRRLHGGGAAEAEADAPPAPVVRLLGFSNAGVGDPAPADDGCCYLVLEMGMYTLDQHLADRREDYEDDHDEPTATGAAAADAAAAGRPLPEVFSLSELGEL